MDKNNIQDKNTIFQSNLTANNLPYLNQFLEFCNNFSIDFNQCELENFQSITNPSQNNIVWNQPIFNLERNKLFNQDISNFNFQTEKSLYDWTKINYCQEQINTDNLWNNFENPQNFVSNDNMLMFNSNFFANNAFPINFPQFFLSNNSNNLDIINSNTLEFYDKDHKLNDDKFQTPTNLNKLPENNVMPSMCLQKDYSFDWQTHNLLNLDNINSFKLNNENSFDNNLFKQQNAHLVKVENTDVFSVNDCVKNNEKKENQKSFLNNSNNYTLFDLQKNNDYASSEFEEKYNYANLESDELTSNASLESEQDDSGLETVENSIQTKYITTKKKKKFQMHPTTYKKLYCKVTSRLSVLNNSKKYNVTVGEIYRRTTIPECLNASILVAILRKAKKKESGKSLRISIEKFGIELPLGRRKSTPITVFTALCEEEAVQLCNDFATVTKQSFPCKELAENLFDSNADLYCKYNAYFLQLITEAIELLNFTQLYLQHAEKDDFNEKIPDLVRPNVGDDQINEEIINSLIYMSRLTHSFGNRAIKITLKALREILNYFKENLKSSLNLETYDTIPSLDEIMNQLI